MSSSQFNRIMFNPVILHEILINIHETDYYCSELGLNKLIATVKTCCNQELLSSLEQSDKGNTLALSKFNEVMFTPLILNEILLHMQEKDPYYSAESLQTIVNAVKNFNNEEVFNAFIHNTLNSLPAIIHPAICFGFNASNIFHEEGMLCLEETELITTSHFHYLEKFCATFDRLIKIYKEKSLTHHLLLSTSESKTSHESTINRLRFYSTTSFSPVLFLFVLEDILTSNTTDWCVPLFFAFIYNVLAAKTS